MTMWKDQFTALAEGIEADFMHRYVSSAPRSAKSQLGIATTRIGGGVALSVRNDVTDYWSKALGLGFTEPINHGLISRIIAFYREQETPGAVIQIAPSALPRDWDEICADHDIHADTPWVKLACRIEDFSPGRTELHVGRVGPATADEWASVTLRGFGMPEEGFAEMVAASVGDPDFRAFAVWDGDEMIAAANLFVHAEIGSLNSAATLPGHRNRGAQSGLLAARASEAAVAGCRWLVAEAATVGDGEANPSLDNMRRCGLRPLYNRGNWVWRNPEFLSSGHS
jgi:hypothetical protein